MRRPGFIPSGLVTPKPAESHGFRSSKRERNPLKTCLEWLLVVTASRKTSLSFLPLCAEFISGTPAQKAASKPIRA